MLTLTYKNMKRDWAMNLKDEVLRILEENRGRSISGPKMAKELFVTRSAIWKVVKSLEDDGYNIKAISNKGYCLMDDNDIVSAESITASVPSKTALATSLTSALVGV